MSNQQANDTIDKLRAEKRRLGGTPSRFSIVSLKGQAGQYSVESVYSSFPGLWDSLQVCLLDDITWQQAGDYKVVPIFAVESILEF